MNVALFFIMSNENQNVQYVTQLSTSYMVIPDTQNNFNK